MCARISAGVRVLSPTRSSPNPAGAPRTALPPR